ncbi:hypothetical protein B296_00023063 [Ensete ventricosum]|uniref:Uncharacterized protein n=1 Tax=Ensete ventricosum TaxID=4639 RepID=A0A427ARN9_ENSVE|nr:hypothetical protein B296_00023063 [Ensete ventricosum]
MDSKEIGCGSSGADLLGEIERLRAEKEELESRIHLLEAQIKPGGAAEKDKSGNCSLSSLSCPQMNGATLSGLSPKMIHRYSRHLLLPDFGVEADRYTDQPLSGGTAKIGRRRLISAVGDRFRSLTVD